jgi:hypothetical protein
MAPIERAKDKVPVTKYEITIVSSVPMALQLSDLIKLRDHFSD